ncbi:TetR/AcrR family transcriptional regulator [Leptospira sp. 201903070]|uniref:TetR/AcrR family transcriptional regulator n=1 Tax=Leptospira ainlahdjerensis TaxID=2810033 RepID=A0ABS2U686_9LEPT|nr:TetR/AcrR family transcriptional regulator [Leptospira ainlahdjerensis]MBM9575892.1 TetR/AcrR family transcriptional regulator [Leptospira ainlahdjerensis]
MKTREKIIQAADELFYERGFANTGVNDLLERSGVHKGSFYKYFREKGDVGLEYLRLRRERNAELFRALTSRYSDFSQLVKAWVVLLRKEAKADRLKGCPFAMFANQTFSSPLSLEEKQFADANRQIREVVCDWEEIFSSYLRNSTTGKKDTLSETEIQSFVRRIVILYEGSIQVYFMTGREEYLKEFQESLLMLGKFYGRV